MQSKNVNNSKTSNSLAKPLYGTVKKNSKNDVSSLTKKDVNTGLRIPGSNWEKFKNLVVETASNEPNSSDLQFKKRKIRKKNYSSGEHHGLQFIDVNQMTNLNTNKDFEKRLEPFNGLTRAIAMDCEMVGIGNGQDSMIARVSIVNRNGICIYDKYVKPTEEVQDYRTAVSGIRPHHLKNGEDFKVVQQEVAEILKGRLLVGHALHNDLAVLFLSHPKRYMRDTSRYKFFRKVTGNTPSLKKLALEFLGVEIQTGEHNSIEDAKTAMQLYQLFRKKWENEIRTKR